MTPKEQAAMQQALIYLDAIINGEGVKPYQLEGTAFTLREALAEQAEQEPVAWRVRGYNQFKTGNPAPWRYVDGADKPTVNKPDCCDFEPLYAAPVRTKDLTDDELLKIWQAQVPASNRVYEFARAVIQVFRRKNGIV